MKNVPHLIFSGLLIFMSCHSQTDTQLENRKPAFADSFYPADPVLLRADLKSFFSEAKTNNSTGRVQAIIVPHAGYVYCGVVAASGYNQLDTKNSYKRIFILACSHRYSIPGAAIYDAGNFETPLGMAKVDIELARELNTKYDIFTFNEQAHAQEHSIEVQLPYLQYRYGDDFTFIPILLGTHSDSDCRKIADALRPYFNKDNLFIISTDFSHYPEYDQACAVDKKTAEAIESNSTEEFINTINRNMEKNIPNLATCACAWPAVLTLLYLTENDPSIEVRHVAYRNSGDIEGADKSRVVGYNAISFIRNEKTLNTGGSEQSMKPVQFELSDKDKKDLLTIARRTLTSYIRDREIPLLNEKDYSPVLRKPAGAFVTLNMNGELRGCIGRFEPDEALYKVVQDMTISSATRDYRFTPVTQSELNNIEIEISVLSPMTRIYDISQFEMGKHGIYIKKGLRSGTFLPQVAEKTGWTKEEFISHCSRDKAGLGWDGWKDAELYIYEAFVFQEGHTK